MVTVLLLFGSPRDETAFDSYFEETHRPLLNRLPNIEQIIVHRVAGAATGTSPYHVIVRTGIPVRGCDARKSQRG